MITRKHAIERAWGPAACLLAPAWLLALALAPGRAGAACLANPDPQIRELQARASQDPTRVLGQVHPLIAALEAQHVRAGAPEAPRLASLYAVEAQADGLLELDAAARTAARKGLQLATDVHDPVHLDLLDTYAHNVYDGAALARALAQVDAARLDQAEGSPADTCLLIARGVIQHRQDRADLAIVSLTRAYRATAAAPGSEPHAIAAGYLSVVMRSVGYYAQALALNQESIDWAQANGATLSLSVARFQRGRIHQRMGNYPAAIQEFGEARDLSVSLDDRQGIAYADLRICEEHLEIGHLDQAVRECTQARRLFAAAHATDGDKEAQTLLARIELAQGRPARALAALNAVLDRRGADLQPRLVAQVYEWRARANAGVGNFAAAYEDQREFQRRETAGTDIERTRQESAMRARFDTDREIERNAGLQRELTASQERARRQAQQLRWNTVVAGAGVVVIALLIYFLAANLRFRKQLLQLASQDVLTGLPNRRRIAELATAAMTAARAAKTPLTLALLDLDHFKMVNDRCGHAAGDYVLQEFARIGRASLGAADVLGRWGGEEFLLVMPGAELSLALANLERLRTQVLGIRLPPTAAGLRVTLSAGVAVHGEQIGSLDEFIARADAALYTAKNEGRDLVRVADERTQFTITGVRRAMRR